MFYIGIDLGTTGCKSVLYDASGSVCAEFNKEYPLIYMGDFIEQDANLWWDIVREAVCYVTDTAGVHEIDGISISTQGISFVPVDADGNTLYNAITWLDMRAIQETVILEKEIGKDYIYSVTGKFLEPDYTLPKLMWLKKHRRDVYDSAYKLLCPLDFLNMKLTGIAATDYTMAGGTMLYDIQKMSWDKKLLDFSGIEEAKLPEVACMGTLLGTVIPSVAEELGINSSAKVYLGGQDQKLAALGAGIDEGICTVSLGTATAITMIHRGFDNRAIFSEFRLNEDMFVSETAVNTSGAALRWLAQVIFGGKSYREMDEIAMTSSPGANGVVIDPEFAEGASINGLTLSTTQGDIVYALYEGVCRKIKECTGRSGNINKLYVFGGGSKSEIWCRILTDITGIDTYVLATAETASCGAAMLASGMELRPAAVRNIIEKKK